LLEPYDAKVSCTVLRGESIRKDADLLDMAYWAYWMRSRLDGTIAEKYALKRNNHYKVNIISVDGVGEPTEDDNLDKDEDLEADASMKATIEVLNWNVVDIEGGI